MKPNKIMYNPVFNKIVSSLVAIAIMWNSMTGVPVFASDTVPDTSWVSAQQKGNPLYSQDKDSLRDIKEIETVKGDFTSISKTRSLKGTDSAAKYLMHNPGDTMNDWLQDTAGGSIINNNPVDPDALALSSFSNRNLFKFLSRPGVKATEPESLDSYVKTLPDKPVPGWITEKEKGFKSSTIMEILGEAEKKRATRSTWPLLDVSPEYLNYAGIQGGSDPGSQMLHLRNKGGSVLYYSLSESIPWLSLGDTSGSVAAGETDDIPVSVNAAGLSASGNPYKGTISLSNMENPSDNEWIRVQFFVDETGGFSTLYSYNSKGYIERLVKPDGNIIDYEYNSIDQVTRISYPDGTSVAFDYDANGNRTSMTDFMGTTYYTYDALNRLTAVYFPSTTQGINLNPVQYEYDNANNLTRIIYPDGQNVFYTYDSDNRLVSVTDASGTTAYEYDPVNGRLNKKTLPNGIFTIYEYDIDGRLTKLGNHHSDNSVISSFIYTLNSNNFISSMTRQTPGETGETIYTYDELARLAEVVYPDGRHVSYEYDSMGNRVSLTDSTAGTTHYTYDLANRMIQAEDEVYIYDANGNIIKRSSPERSIDYTYDYNNQLIRYNDGETTVEFVYNGDGQRVGKIVNGKRINYVIDVHGERHQVLLEADAGFHIEKRYTFGIDRIGQGTSIGDQSYYLYSSPLRSVSEIADYAGTVTESYDYDAFGMPKQFISPGENSILYNGEQYDTETGLIYLRSRYYDPGTGRFTTRDIWAGVVNVPQSVNPYIYALNNPVNITDPDGDLPFLLIPILVGIFAGVGSKYVGDVIGNVARGEEKWWTPTSSVGEYIGAGIAGGLSGWIGAPGAAGGLGLGGIGWGILTGAGTSVVGNLAGQGIDNLCGFKSGFDTGSLIDDAIWGGIGGGITGGLTNWRYPNKVPGRYPTHLESVFLGKHAQRVYKEALIGAGVETGLSLAKNYGGVSLNKTADLLLDIESIVGATYDPLTGQLILYGRENDTMLPEMDMDHLAVAVQSVYTNQDPGVSIDPPLVNNEFTVRYDGKTAETEFGYIMFEADRILKCLSLGKDNLGIKPEPFPCSVPGYMSMLNRELNSGECANATTSDRMWFQPKEVRLVLSEDGVSMVYDQVSMEVLTESKMQGQVNPNPEAENFAYHFTTHYNDFAGEFPIYSDLEQLGRIVAVVKWIHDNNIPLDLSFLDNYQIKYFDTPEYTPATTVSGTNSNCMITITGGVSYSPPNEYIPDTGGETDVLGSAAINSRQGELDFEWNFTAPVTRRGIRAGEELTAVAQSMAPSRKDGNFQLTQEDMNFPVNGFSLGLTRYYNSFNDESSGFGKGWSELPYQLIFPGSRYSFIFGGSITRDAYAQITVVERPENSENIFRLLGLDENNHPVYARSGSMDILRDNENGTFTLCKKDKTLIQFNASGQLVSITDTNNNQLAYAYSNNRLARIYQPGTREISLTYNSLGQIIGANGPEGSEMAYSYNAERMLVAAADIVANQRITYSYDNDGYLIRAEDNKGNVVFDQGYDAYGRSTNQTIGSTADYVYDYDLRNRESVVIDPSGNSTVKHFDDDYRLLSSTDPLNNEIKLSYNGDAGPGRITDSRGAVTQFYYDRAGNLAAVIDDEGNLEYMIYDAKNNLIAKQDSRGAATAYEYDLNNNLKIIHKDVLLNFDSSGNYIDFDGDSSNVISLTYDTKGNITTVSDSRGNTRWYDYDEYGIVTGISQESGLNTNIVCDNLSRPTEINNGAGESISFDYDNADNVRSISTGSGSIQYTYDGNNNISSVSDSSGNPPTYYEYNEKNNLVRVTDAAGNDTHYTYDDMGNIKSTILPNDTTITYDYDELNRTVRVVYGVGPLSPDIAIAQRDLDFGRVQYNESKTMNLQVFNQGTGDLTIYGITSDNPVFSADIPRNPVIPGSGSTEIPVTFTPTGYEMYTGTLTIQGNDPDETYSTVTLTGRGKNIVTGLAAATQHNGIQLTWDTFDAPDLDHFHIYREETPINSSVSGLSPYTSIADPGAVLFLDSDRNLVAGTLYYYAVTPVSLTGYEDHEVESAGPVSYLSSIDTTGPVIPADDQGSSDYNPQVVCNSLENQYLVVWERDNSGIHAISGQLFNADGTPAGDVILIGDGQYNERNPRAAYSSSGNQYVVVYEYDLNGNGSDYVIAVQVLSSDGTKAWPVSSKFTDITDSFKPDITYNTVDDQFFIVFEHISNDRNVLFSRIIMIDGTDLLCTNPISLELFPSFDRNYFNPRVVHGGISNTYMISFEYDASGLESNFDIGVLSLSFATGNATIRVFNIPYDDRKPQLSYNSLDNQYICVWEQLYENDNWITLNILMNDDTTPVLEHSNLVGGFLYHHDRAPQVAYNEVTNTYHAIFEFDYYQNGLDWDIAGQRLNSNGEKQGKPYFIKSSFYQELSPHLAYNPSVNEYFAVWEFDFYGDGNNWNIEGRRIGGTIPVLNVDPVHLTFGIDSSQESIYITNWGTGYLHWFILSNVPWLNAQPGTGETLGGESTLVDITVNRNDLSPGSHTGKLLVVSDDINTEIIVDVTEINHPASWPENPLPQNNAVEVTSPDPDLALTLQWDCMDPDKDPLTYSVYLGTTTSPYLAATGLTEPMFTTQGLMGHTTYYWMVEAFDGYDSTFGPLWNFTTANRPPFVPYNPSPAHGALSQPMDTVLTWTGGDPDGDPVTYTVFFGEQYELEQAATDIATPSWDPPGDLDPGKIYHWQITSTDGSAESTGPVWRFRTVAPDLAASEKNVDKVVALPGEKLTYTFMLVNNGGLDADTVILTDPLPDNTTWIDELSWTGGGNAVFTGNTLSWTGNLAVGKQAEISYSLQVNDPVPYGTVISNRATLDDGTGVVVELEATTFVDCESPVVEVLSPNGNESWRIGEMHLIRWNARDDHFINNPVSLYYSMDNGQSWHEIIAGAENSGSYSWTIPDVEPGLSLVKLTATDVAENTGEDQSNAAFKITIIDTTPPEMIVPADITAEAKGILTTVNIGEPVIHDTLPVTVMNTAPDTFALGTTSVTWLATDLNDNITTGTQRITVQDTTPPKLHIPQNITVEATARTTPVDIGQATATDIFTVISITNNAPDKFRLGKTDVKWTAADENGNIASRTQRITVVDTTPPVLKVPKDITVKATGILTPVNIGTATATDIFDAAISNDLSDSIHPKNLFPVGLTIVTWTAKDKNGNTSTGTQRINVFVDPGPFGD